MFWKREKNKKTEYTCSECGQVHSDWPALVFLSPTNYHILTPEEKETIGTLNSDFCEIHYEDQIGRFIRVTFTQKVNDSCKDLEYGLWVSLNEKNFLNYKEKFDTENHDEGYFGWLCSRIPEYDNTLSIPCDVIIKKGNSRPEIFPHESFDHSFVRDYYNGISHTEAVERIQKMLEN